MLKRMLLPRRRIYARDGRLVAIRTWTGFRAATPGQTTAHRPCPCETAALPGDWATRVWASPLRWPRGVWWPTRSWAGPRIPVEPYLPGRTSRGHQEASLTLTVNGKPVDVSRRIHGRRRRGVGGRVGLSALGQRRAARPALRHGHLLRVPGHHRRPAAPAAAARSPACRGWRCGPRNPVPDSTYDVLVVGAGPAGLAAARRAPESGARVRLLDDNPTPGGQIWRAGAKCAGSVRWLAG